MIVRWAAAAIFPLAFTGAAAAAERHYPVQPAPSYPLQAVDQFDPTSAGDVLPGSAVSVQLIRGDLARAVVESGWDLNEMRTASMSLEEIFLQLTGSEAETEKAADSGVLA